MGYVQAAQLEDKADDTNTQITRMNDLAETAENKIEAMKVLVKEIEEKGEIKSKAIPEGTDPLKYIDQELWNIEIDIENANDLSRRLTEDNKQTLREKLKSIMPAIF